MSDDILQTQQVLIDRLREEVNQADKTIQLEIERQTEDLSVMRKRMKDHLDSTRATQRCQLGEIDANHTNLMDQMLADWSASENQIIRELNELGSQWMDDLYQTDVYYYNECTQIRNSLTSDIQLIEQELEKLKVDFALNNEVLDYNCRVLKLREEERAGVIVQHKRKINRLTDRYRQLKEESNKAGQVRREEELKLIKEIEHLRKDCESMECKFSTIKGANDRQLESVCEMAEDRISELLKKLASIDERIFVEILEQPWDNLISMNFRIFEKKKKKNSKQLEQVVVRLEKNLQFLTDTISEVDSPKERLMKALDIPDEHEFHVLLTDMHSVPDSDILKELACYIQQQRSRPADQPVTTRRYLADAATIRNHFELFKETAVPKKRLDMWKMLARALVQYERILRDRLTLAADVLALTTQSTALD
ncbi:putative Dynein regulatory complex protein 1 [Daphnia magna]|uniref:Putative Dynein regulatory complex protein 1 n=1 Tax=Daphnia magna TaxID=35525 RepID=A0A164WUD8_9CRUS|nr:putative Dynein regulatory complex protein 1 [Daphnia magna]